MDITHLFKAAFLTVKRQRKNVLPPDKTKILKPISSAANRDEFARQAKDAIIKITALRDLLLENRTAYMRIGQHLKSAVQMTDEQRDLIDRESEKFFAFYAKHLIKLRSDWKTTKRKPQHHQHIDGVLELLTNYLNSVQKIFLEQKKYRVQHELETYRLLKLAADKKKIPITPGGGVEGKAKKRPASITGSVGSSDDDIVILHSSKDNDSNDNNSDGYSSDMDMSDGWQLNKNDDNNDDENSIDKNSTANTSNNTVVSGKSLQSITSQKVAIDDDIEKSEQLDEEETKAAEKLNPEDVQMFEEENVQLYLELQGVHEDVAQIEKNVVDIAQLQDIFTEKVALQQFNIERIANAVVGTTENVKDANEQIKQAIQRNAGLRVWSLFFLLVMSFTLLFLDWYYD